MPQLWIWTGAKTRDIKPTFGVALQSFRPNIPAHSFIEFKDDDTELPKIGLGDVLIASGNKIVEVLQKAGVVPKGRKVNSLRETPVKYGLGWLLVTFDPGIIASEPDKGDIIGWDLRLAHRLMTTGQLKPQIGTYNWVRTLQPVVDFVKKRFEKTGKPVPIAADSETMGLYPWYPDKDFVVFQVTYQPGSADCVYLGPAHQSPIPQEEYDPNLFEQIEFLLTSPMVSMRGANFKYDLVWIKEKWGITCTNFKFDTMLVGSLLNENRNNSLNVHAKLMTAMGGYDDDFNGRFDKGAMEAIKDNAALLTYSGGDTDACYQVADVLRDELLDDPHLATFYIKVLHPGARAFEKVEARGVLVDQERFAKVRQDLLGVIDEAQKKALGLLPGKMRIKYMDRIDEQLASGKSPLLPKILHEYFFTPNGLNLKPKMLTGKTQQPSMAKSHLKMFGETPDAMAMVDALTKLDQALKTKSTFVDGFLKHLRPDGRFHPTYFLGHADFEEADDDESGTTTGRLSAKGPAIQIVPKRTLWGKRIRECFVAPKGKVILARDYSQGELRVVACVAPEKNMIAAYEAGMDMHTKTGAGLAQVPYDEFLSWKESSDEKLAKMFSDLRDRAKAGNFGLLYGMGAEGFMAYAWANYGLKLTLEEAEKIRDLFFAEYPDLTKYHTKQKNLVKMHEMVRSPLGRIRHLPMIRSWDRSVSSKAERQAINSPIQATLTDMMIWAIALIEDAFPNDEVQVFAMIHDAFYAYVDEDKVAQYAKVTQEIMENLPFHQVGWEPQLKFPSDAEAGPDLAHLSKVKIAA